MADPLPGDCAKHLDGGSFAVAVVGSKLPTPLIKSLWKAAGQTL